MQYDKGCVKINADTRVAITRRPTGGEERLGKFYRFWEACDLKQEAG